MHSLEASRGMGIVMEAEGASIIEAAEREWKRHLFVETRDARVAEQLEIKSGPEVAELARTAEQCKTYLDGGQELLDSLPSYIQYQYARDFATADADFFNGRVAQTTKNRATCWSNWCSYVRPLGVDPYLQGESYQRRARTLTGFAARIRNGGYCTGRKVKGDTVSTALSAVGQEIHLVCGVNPVKAQGSDKFVPRVAQTLDGMRKEDGPVLKKLPVEVDVVEYLVKMAMLPGAMDLAQAVGDLSMIAFYYLLR